MLKFEERLRTELGTMTGIGTYFKMAKPSVVSVGQVRQIVRVGSELIIATQRLHRTRRSSARPEILCSPLTCRISVAQCRRCGRGGWFNGVVPPINETVTGGFDLWTVLGVQPPS